MEVKLQMVRGRRLTRQDQTPTSQYVEVIGRVSRTGDSVTQHALLSLGDNLGRCLPLTADLSLVEHLVVLTPQYPTLFSE